jgi:thiamine transport system permease protein
MRLDKVQLLWLFPALFFALFLLLPVARLIATGANHEMWQEVAHHRTAAIVLFTLWQALASSLISAILSIPLAYILYRTASPGSRTMRTLIALPFFLPNIVVAIMWRAIFPGAAGVGFIILGNILMNVGLATRILGSQWRALDSEIDAAAALDGAGKLRTALSISLPQLRPALFSAALLTTLYCMANFGIVLALGTTHTNTIETDIYQSATVDLNLSRSSTLVLIQIAITITIGWVAARLSRTAANALSGPGPSQTHQRFSRRDLPAFLFSLVLILALILTPILALFVKAFSASSQFTITHFTDLLSPKATDLLAISLIRIISNTFRNAVVVTIMAVALGTLIAYLLARSGKLGTLIQLPIGISSEIIGLGFLLTFTRGLFPLQSTWLVLPIAQTLFIVPLVARTIHPILITQPREELESAEIDRASSSQIWWQIQYPPARRVIAIAAGYAALSSIGDFGSSNFLAFGEQSTLTQMLFAFITRPGTANYGMAMAISSILVLICAAIVAISEW